ncbi:conserved secreted [Trichoderma cornu-damae]|uniref:Conserved secreted n=1 Tax=Trichoderma cornu-damae TaxID=654480 RepID=A0A9P8QUG8_9HYPO|nr:conserved secreted [Trichoderma cornu-damae]
MGAFKKLLQNLNGRKSGDATRSERDSKNRPPNNWSGIDNTQPEGDNPIRGFSTEYLGEQRSSNSASRRDLGFAGHIQGKWYAVYGDTLWCAPGVTDPDRNPEGFHGMVRNSVSALTEDPLVVRDLHLNDDEPVPHQKQFTPFVEEWGETNQFGFGGTSIVEVDYEGAVGALYYLINEHENYRHAGIARVEVIDEVPTITKRLGDGGWWWDCSKTAKYGDIAAYRDVKGEYIYIWGHPPKTATEWPATEYVYLARVRAAEAFDLGEYEYWWGRDKGWRAELLSEHNPETAVMWGVGQGQVVYSEWFKCYIYVHLNGPNVALRTAPRPEGPWSDDQEVFTAEPIEGGFVYAGVAYPYLDETGRTLTVAFTNNNRIQVIRVAFE